MEVLLEHVYDNESFSIAGRSGGEDCPRAARYFVGRHTGSSIAEPIPVIVDDELILCIWNDAIQNG